MTACTVKAAMRAAARLDTAQRRKAAGREARALKWGIAGSDAAGLRAAGLRAALLPMQQCWLACRVAAISAETQSGPHHRQIAQRFEAAAMVSVRTPEESVCSIRGRPEQHMSLTTMPRL